VPYAKARALESRLAAAYDAGLAKFDVLAMPTVPIAATLIPPGDAPLEEILGRALEMMANTAGFDVTGHPACSIPAGLSGGLPVGLTVIGRRFDDAGVLRAAHAFESTLGTLTAPTRLTKV
jgi:amidase